MDTIEIILPGKPLPWKAPYVGSRGAWSCRTPILNQLRTIARLQYDGEPITEAVVVDIFFHFPIPTSTSRKKRLKMLDGEILPIGRPDRTNCAKLFEDVLNGIVYADDSQIIDGRISKRYADVGSTRIVITKF